MPTLALLLASLALALPDSFDTAGKPLQRPAAPEAVAGTAQEADEGWVEIKASGKVQRTEIASAGVSIEEVQPGLVRGFATRKAVARLRAKGFAVKQADIGMVRPEDFPKEDAAYHNYAELVKDMVALAQQAPELASVFSIGKSVQGRDLVALRLNTSAKGSAASTKPGAVFLGTHHAREHLSTEVPLLVAKHLIENRKKPEIAQLLKDRDVYFIPMVNPDGVEYDIEGDRYHMHRKNMRKNPGGAIGVDLNRNYDWRWGGAGASDDEDSDVYHGPSAFSEPETQAVRDFCKARKNLKMLLSYHTFSELILYPWGGSYDPIPDGRALAAYKAMAQKMAEWTGYTPQQSSDLYVATGDTTDWTWGELGIFSFTFELTPKSMWNGGGFYPGAGAIQKTFAANLKPALYLIELADDPYRAGAPQLAGSAAGSAGR